MLIDTIGPVWNGNEVWLLAAGGAMFVAFPHVYAASFSGFYLALMLVLWLLLLRGLGIEFRHQIDNDLWKHAWDVVFSVASAVLAVLFGVALANVLRGVPLDGTGEFRGTFALLLNPFAILGGLLSLCDARTARRRLGGAENRGRSAGARAHVGKTALVAGGGCAGGHGCRELRRAARFHQQLPRASVACHISRRSLRPRWRWFRPTGHETTTARRLLLALP